MTLKPTALSVALMMAFAAAPALAQSNDDLLKELRALKSKVEELEKKLQAVPAPPAEGQAQWGMTQEQSKDFNRLLVKTEALEDAQESQGFKSLKIAGYMDPSFIYNKNQNRAGFQFLSPVNDDGYNYDNSYFGTVSLDFQKELEGGTKWRLTLMPSRGAGLVANPTGGSIVHEASVSVPLDDLSTRVIAGQIPDWSGYEYIQATTTKLVTRGLLLDFTEPTAYTAAGMEFIRGKFDTKVVVGNFNTPMRSAKQTQPVIAYRVDYSKGEFDGWGLAGVEGKVWNPNTGETSRLDLFEFDTYFIRGDLTLQGQAGFGRQRQASTVPDANGNLRDAQWFGLSGLAAYKLEPRLEAVARLDYLRNDKNGGGLLGYSGFTDADGNAFGTDGRNGIGVSPTCFASEAAATCKGANRTALAVGMNYLLTSNTTLKAEYRLDTATQAVFYDARSGAYKKQNQLLGASMVVSF